MKELMISILIMMLSVLCIARSVLGIVADVWVSRDGIIQSMDVKYFSVLFLILGIIMLIISVINIIYFKDYLKGWQ